MHFSCSRGLLRSTLMLFLLASAAPVPATASDQTLVFSSGAFGTTAFVDATVISGQTAQVSIGPGCGTTQVGVTHTATVLTASAPPLLVTGLVNSSGGSTAASSTASSDVNQVNLLSGLITANEIKGESNTSFGANGLASTSAGSDLVSMQVNGTTFTAVPAPNTTIDLPGIGRVVLNEQFTSTGSSSQQLTVNMIHVYVTVANSLGIKTGTQIIVAHAVSGLTVAGGPGVLDGTAYGTRIQVGTVLFSSPTAVASVPCLGTSGKVHSNTLLAVNLQPTLVSGTVTDTDQGDITSSLASAETTSTVQTVSLLSSLVSADLVKADAHASTTDGTAFNFSDQGSSFVNLKVQGHPEIGDNVPPNTQVALNGIGTLWLHRVITTSDSIEVRMIELIVNAGPATGSNIRVARAEASLHSNTHP